MIDGATAPTHPKKGLLERDALPQRLAEKSGRDATPAINHVFTPLPITLIFATQSFQQPCTISQ